MKQAVKQNDLIEEEFENSPVPLQNRKSLFSVTMVWVGFPMIITSAVTGATLVQGLGFGRGLAAMIVGNLLLFAYVGLLSALGAKNGLNFAMLASRTFGKRGYMFPSGLLSTLVIGWFAVQTGLTGTTMAGTFPVNPTVIAVVAGVLYLLLTLIGIRALSFIGIVSAPLFVILGLYVAIEAVGNGQAIWSYQGNPGIALSFGVAVTLVFALFVDSGTLTADFTRWAKNRGHATFATFAAFPVANLIAMLIGGIIAASSSGTGDLFGAIATKGGWLAAVAVLFLFVNLGSVCSHCLYNAAVGWSSIVKGNMRVLAVILGIVGIVLAALGVWNYFIDWLNLLGVIVPPIGTIMIVDHYLTRKRDVAADEQVRAKPFIAWLLGSAAALLANYYFPDVSTAVIGIVVSGLAYWLISLNESTVTTADLTAKSDI